MLCTQLEGFTNVEGKKAALAEDTCQLTLCVPLSRDFDVSCRVLYDFHD
jgi:hypothetical protein